MIEKLVVEEIVELAYKSSKHTEFRLVDREATKRALEIYRRITEVPTEDVIDIPDDLFKDVVGYDDLKELFMKALKTGGVHFLLVGPPASGKTMFLFCLERLKSTKYLIGSRVTKAGLARFLFDNKPRVLLLDEIDKMDAEHYGILLSLCESGRVTEMLSGREREILLNTTVFACCNKMDRLPPEIVSRFAVIKFKKYGKKEFKHVATELLQRMGKDEKLAERIAICVADELGSTDPREAVRLARLCDTIEDVEKYVGVLKHYR